MPTLHEAETVLKDEIASVIRVLDRMVTARRITEAAALSRVKSLLTALDAVRQYRTLCDAITAEMVSNTSTHGQTPATMGPPVAGPAHPHARE
jgi:hypothetical protein